MNHTVGDGADFHRLDPALERGFADFLAELRELLRLAFEQLMALDAIKVIVFGVTVVMLVDAPAV